MSDHVFELLLRPHEVRPGYLRVFWISILAGFLGVVTGIALFVRLAHHATTAGKLLTVLSVVALLSFTIEYLRGKIDGHEHKLSVPSVIITLLVLAVFELFVSAAHTALELNPGTWWQIGTAIVGTEIASKSPISERMNLLVMGGLWIVIGMAISIALGTAIWIQDRSRRFLASGVGLVVGAIFAPALALAYVLFIRVIMELQWAVTTPAEWVSHLDGTLQLPFFAVWYLKIPLLILKGLTTVIGRWGPVVGFVAVIVVLLSARRNPRPGPALVVGLTGLLAYVIPLAGVSVWQNLLSTLNLGLLMAVIWVFPAVLLGFMAPYLNRDDATSFSWSCIAWLASAVLIAFWILLHSWWYLISAGLLVAAGIAFAKGASVKQYWPVIPLSVATFVVGITQLTLTANFLYVQELSSTLIQEPLGKLSRRYVAPPFTPIFSPELRAMFEKYSRGGSLGNPRKLEDLLGQWPSVSDAVKYIDGRIQDSSGLLGEHTQLGAKAEHHLEELAQATRNHHKLELLEKEPELSSHSRTLLSEIDGLAKKMAAAPAYLSEARIRRDKIKAIYGRMRFGVWRDPQPVPDPVVDPLDRQVTELAGLTEEIGAQAKTMAGLRTRVQSAQELLAGHVLDARKSLAQTFELCVTGALGFWAATGMLAIWAVRAERVRKSPAAIG